MSLASGSRERGSRERGLEEKLFLESARERGSRESGSLLSERRRASRGEESSGEEGGGMAWVELLLTTAISDLLLKDSCEVGSNLLILEARASEGSRSVEEPAYVWTEGEGGVGVDGLGDSAWRGEGGSHIADIAMAPRGEGKATDGVDELMALFLDSDGAGRGEAGGVTVKESRLTCAGLCCCVYSLSSCSGDTEGFLGEVESRVMCFFSKCSKCSRRRRSRLMREFSCSLIGDDRGLDALGDGEGGEEDGKEEGSVVLS